MTVLLQDLCNRSNCRVIKEEFWAGDGKKSNFSSLPLNIKKKMGIHKYLTCGAAGFSSHLLSIKLVQVTPLTQWNYS